MPKTKTTRWPAMTPAPTPEPETMPASRVIATLDILATNAEKLRDDLRAKLAQSILDGDGPRAMGWSVTNLAEAEARADALRSAADWLAGRHPRSPHVFNDRWEALDAIAEETRQEAIRFACTGPEQSTNPVTNAISTATRTARAKVWLDSFSGLVSQFDRFRVHPASGGIVDDVTRD